MRTSQKDVVDSTEIQAELLVRWIKRTTAPVLVGLGAAALAAPLVIPIIDGGRYPDSIAIFQLLLIPAVVMYTTMPGPNLLMAQRRYRLLAVLYTVALAAQVAGAVSGALLWDVIGVAALTAVVGALENAAVAYLAARHGRAEATRPRPRDAASATRA